MKFLVYWGERTSTGKNRMSEFSSPGPLGTSNRGLNRFWDRGWGLVLASALIVAALTWVIYHQPPPFHLTPKFAAAVVLFAAFWSQFLGRATYARRLERLGPGGAKNALLRNQLLIFLVIVVASQVCILIALAIRGPAA